MRKGDIKRDSILSTAQRLFFERGYDQTSIQDILDALNMSKGGFYHHFVSKEAVLSEICQRHAAQRLDNLEIALTNGRLSAVDKLNALLRRVNLIDGDDVHFAGLLLKICYAEDDAVIRQRMRAVICERVAPWLDEVILQGIAEDAFFTRKPGRIGRIVLSIAADADDEGFRILAGDPDNPDRLLEIMDLLDAGRDSIELLLGAPYGSVTLFEPAGLISAYRAAAEELMRIEGKR